MARTSQAITQAEADAFSKFALDNHLETGGAAGEANGTALGGPIVNQGFDINAGTLKSVFSQIKDTGALTFKSPAKERYDEAVKTFCTSQHDVEFFESWFKAQSRHMKVEGDDGYDNAVKILSQMVGKEFTHQRLTLELQRAFANKEMHVTPRVEKAYSPHSGGSAKWDNERTNRPFLPSHSDRYRS